MGGKGSGRGSGGKRSGAGRPRTHYILREQEAVKLRLLAKRDDETPQEYLEKAIRVLYDAASSNDV